MASQGEQDGEAALTIVENSEPVVWLAGNAHLSHQTKKALEYLYGLAKNYAAHCPLPRLLAFNFDCEQIWQQIDLQSAPLLRIAKRRLKHLQYNTDSLVHLHGLDKLRSVSKTLWKDNNDETSQSEPENLEDQENNVEVGRDGEEEEEDHNQGGLSGNSESEEDGVVHAVEDKFFKVKDMERFLNDAEAPQNSAISLPSKSSTLESDEDESEEEEDGDDDMEVDLMHSDGEQSKDRSLNYNDFFGGSKQRLVDIASEGINNCQSQALLAQFEPLTAHEKQLLKVEKHIKDLESANLNSALWTMQGEVSAAKRPRNSALEVELDFEHNVRPAPIITEEVTVSLEDLIRTRIAENNFDDVQRKLFSRLHAPNQERELDEMKSQRGLAELYEDDYMQKTGLAPVSSSSADEARKEATQLFKAVCVKLDALSHFHFTPKPVIEDMAVRQDVPALAMEEVAPLMVSDAQMLAPEEHFTGEGVFKANTELSREEKKRYRARKKEKARVERRRESYKKPSFRNLQLQDSQGSLPSGKRRREGSQYSKSKKVFEQLDETSKKVKKVEAKTQVLRAPFLEL